MTVIYQATYQARGDLRSNQFYLCEFVAADQVQRVSSTAAVACGIIQNNPNSGESCLVTHIGTSKTIATSGITVGEMVGAAATGAARRVIIGTDTAVYAFAQSIETFASGDIRRVLVRGTPTRGA